MLHGNSQTFNSQNHSWYSKTLANGKAHGLEADTQLADELLATQLTPGLHSP